MNNHKEFNHLILLIGTNPLPNFVVADYFLQTHPNIQTIWLLHSEENRLQAGTHKQAKRLEALLCKQWHSRYQSLQFPLEKISLSDVSDAMAICSEIERKMLNSWADVSGFHLNYTGGTKAMATHVYRRLQDFQKTGQHPFSYLDSNNFRLVVDGYGIETDDLRKRVRISFEELITLHGFQVKNKNSSIDENNAVKAYEKFLDVQKFSSLKPIDGTYFEQHVFLKLSDKFETRLNDSGEISHNLLIKDPAWRTYFELDITIINGYHLTGISCTVSNDKKACKTRGFEIILRTRQIGGDEARAVLITRSDRNQTKILQDELAHETGGQDNILVLGIEDLRKESIYLRKIEEFVFN